MNKQMNKQTNEMVENYEFEIDLLHLIKILWEKVWVIILCTILLGAVLLSYAYFFITPQYQAKARMYVNNSSFTMGNASFSFSSSELSAAKSLLDTYIIIMKGHTTLDQVLEETGLEYTRKELSEMISASSVNSTEVFEIVATSSDPQEAELIVNTIVRILPDRVADIVDGSSVRLVDHALKSLRTLLKSILN